MGKKPIWDKKCPSQNKLNDTTALTSGRPTLSLTSPELDQPGHSFLHRGSDRAVRYAILLQRAVLNSARASRLRRNLATHANSVSIISAVTSTASLSLNCVASILKEVADAFDHIRGDH